jgi:hypothetical protein
MVVTVDECVDVSDVDAVVDAVEDTVEESDVVAEVVLVIDTVLDSVVDAVKECVLLPVELCVLVTVVLGVEIVQSMKSPVATRVSAELIMFTSSWHCSLMTVPVSVQNRLSFLGPGPSSSLSILLSRAMLSEQVAVPPERRRSFPGEHVNPVKGMDWAVEQISSRSFSSETCSPQ